jgi:hypothetical protein
MMKITPTNIPAFVETIDNLDKRIREFQNEREMIKRDLMRMVIDEGHCEFLKIDMVALKRHYR